MYRGEVVTIVWVSVKISLNEGRGRGMGGVRD